MKTKEKIIFSMFILLAFFNSGCASQTEVEVTREVIVTQTLQTEVKVTRLVEIESDTQADPVSFSPDSLNDEMIIEKIQPEAFEETFRLYISLPLNYEDGPHKTYPVLYLMDGNFDTQLANLLVWTAKYEGSVPDMIIVGVGYDTNIDFELNDLRLRDLMPTGNKDGYGRADDLLAFMQNELIPHIDNSYQTNPERRFLAGFSAGGTFAIYAMFQAPELFEGFVATSPALLFEGWSAFDEADNYAENHTDLPANLFISVGSKEDSGQLIEQYVNQMNGQEYESFQVKTVTLEGEHHLGMWAVGMQRGIKEIFRSPAW